MTLSKQYSIATRHQRSTRIDSDLSADFFPGLVYHGTAQASLETLFRQYGQTGQSAYTLTGAYGSGKSTVALLMAGLLHSDSDIRSAAINTINAESKSLLEESAPYQKGWLQIRAVGGVSGPVESFWNATLRALEEHPNTHKAKVLNKYRKASVESDSELISSWKALFDDVAPHVDGVLIIADEMGKSLEFINRNGGDLHLFQDIAEELSRIDTPVIFLGLLHQAFSEYAKERGTKLQDEWAKIQGRFSDILYNVSTDETVALISNSIKTTSPHRSGDELVQRVLSALEDKQQRKELLLTRLEQCVPLHPLTALLLGPIAKRRFSQNERSTFGFLNSHEQFSFQLFLQQTSDQNARYDLSNLWDYLEANMEHAILGSPDGHGWATAADALRKAFKQDFSPRCIALLKAISLITLFGKSANLTATESVLLTATDIIDKKQLKECLQQLKEASCIVFRKHLSSWVVFEGSDLDIAGLVEEKIEQLHNSHEAVERINFSSQVIAKGHYHEFGTLRWAAQTVAMQLNYIDMPTLIGSRSGEFANFLLLLKEEPEDRLLELTRNDKSLMIACAPNANEIINLANEKYVLELIKSDKSTGAALTHDKVAREEHRARLFNAQSALDAALTTAFNNARWIHNGEIYGKETMSEIATFAADRIFHKTPRILNELVNRNKLSGTAVSALKKLLEAMLDEEDREDLGIEGFPPEKSMYISCLKNTNIHSAEGEKGQHWFRDHLDKNLNAVFAAAEKRLKDRKGNEVDLSEIAELWANAPFGLTKGVIPIFLLAFLKSMGEQIAFYEKDMSGEFAFIAEPDSDYVHKLIKNPGDLAVKYIVLAKDEKEWLQHLAIFAASETNRDVSNNILSVAKPLVTTMHNLPHWVKNAHHIVPDNDERNKTYLRIRDLFLQANDPHTLLIKDLRKELIAFGADEFTSQIDLLEDCFKTLRQKHEQMLAAIKTKVKTIFPESGEELTDMCQYVEQNSGDLRLKAFARELAKSDTGLLQWLESMIQIVIGRGKQNWNEGILQTASNKISDYAQDFLSVVKSQRNGGDAAAQSGKTKLVSLVLEGDDGKLTSFKREIRAIETEELKNTMSTIEHQLSELDDFHKINLLQQLLRKSLEAQS
ncbi:hypothetical protein NB541_20170 [Vibrio parahaemolyticus]|uniref:hypothetical protein n=1 Tax=Vibrio parahaemolyticus TaxID=670 RepID=UPI00215BA279|nr:hypothetical protein [Vibrio parahaemolyticus]MCR9957696.1 hypothetical protein [Vibrio parahaemolyticus]